MTNVELVKRFFEIEQKYCLFEQKTQDGVFWWDIVRYHIYVDLLALKVRNNSKSKDTSVIQKVNKFQILLDKLQGFRKTFMLLLSDLFLLIKTNKSSVRYFFFIYPRNIDKNGNAIDNISNDVLSKLKKMSFVVDILKTQKTEEVSYNNVLLSVFRKFSSVLNKRHCLGLDVNAILNTEFGTNEDFELKIQKFINVFNIDYRFYKYFLFKLFSPNAVFMVSTGSEKGLIAASRDLGINVSEIQHCQTNWCQLNYSYPQFINSKKIKTVPDVFLTFSEHWNKVNYPVGRKVVIGNSAYRNLKLANGDNKDIVVICSSVYLENLLQVTKQLASNVTNRKIIFKLHPEQRNELDFIRQEFKDFSNVLVVLVEKTVSEIFQEVGSIITIQSTTVYEALQVGLRVFIYKKQDYDSHSDVFDCNGLYLFDTVDDILRNLDNPSQSNSNIFFCDFKGDVLDSFINELS